MGQARSMMNFAGFTTEKREQLWCEAANTAMMIDNILVHEQKLCTTLHQVLWARCKVCQTSMNIWRDLCNSRHFQQIGSNKINTRG